MKVLVIDDEHEHVIPILNGLERRKRKDNWEYYYPAHDNVADIKADIENNLSFEPDVVLLDLMIPKEKSSDRTHRGGLDLIDMIKNNEFNKITEQARIIILSADDKLDEVRQTYGFKIDRCFSKPCVLKELFKELENKD